MQNYFFALLGGLILAAIFTMIVRTLALRARVVDVPDEGRKKHAAPVPLWGGMAIYAAVVCGLVLLGSEHLWTIAIPGAILVVGGALDDRFGLRPWKQFLFPLAAVVAAILLGVTVTYVRNPLGGILPLGALALPITFAWLLGMTYTTKLLDGLDGLATGIGALGAFFVFALALRPELNQPETALVAILITGVLLGFLPWNFHPARIFLGEGGSTLVGFLVGVLAIISGSKVATTLLVVGIPALDVAWVILRRIFKDRKSPASGDRKHLHFRLLDAGFSHRGTVLFLWTVAAIFGGISVFVQTGVKLVLLGLLFLLMTIGGLWLVRKSKSITNY